MNKINPFVPEGFKPSDKPGLSYAEQKKIEEQNKKTGLNYDIDKEAVANNINSLQNGALGQVLDISV